MMTYFDVLIIGASASGLMCAIEAGKRGRKVVVLDHAAKAGKKIRISGGGRCNFTNYDVSAEHYLSQNKHFCKSALSRYQYYDFLTLLADYKISWHERDHGQLFCDRSANDIVQMLLSECKKYPVTIQLDAHINSVENHLADEFQINASTGHYQAKSLVIATGGLSVSKMDASDFGLRLAKQFALNVIPTRPGLVPLSYNVKDSKRYKQLAGIALEAEVSYGEQRFKENLLFTHKGISGPAVLQISSYWLVENGKAIHIKLLPDLELHEWLLLQQTQQANLLVKNILAQKMPKRLVECLCHLHAIDKPIKQYSESELNNIADVFQHWHFWPDATEGYRVAEVTVGGVDTHDLSSKTMQAKNINGLYFIGEVVDITGHLGGYNFQWAWSSGYTAGQFV
ncbi:MAG: NAD(P)/FAD-dependent oxidoreductase [gamma proteobacterium symbiont of Lucinoma myriamae]|nr:NAD(P)/FAD-dependent oxidoreductase [gamma proteobacterium symbiont of Lucinoma myriamae]MCU7832561.1 NAD(P)/FAD-dependent oxidoreductase [gamma proteobacterium symbiont of Lucinoma myriamae]